MKETPIQDRLISLYRESTLYISVYTPLYSCKTSNDLLIFYGFYRFLGGEDRHFCFSDFFSSFYHSRTIVLGRLTTAFAIFLTCGSSPGVL